jgi:putative transposase
MVEYILKEHQTSGPQIKLWLRTVSRACRLMSYCRSGVYYQSRKEDEPVQDKLREGAGRKLKEGFWKLFGRIRKEGLQ